MRFLEKLKFNGEGLIPAIIQEQNTGRVLMMAWMNDESLRKTLETGRTWFWSRSRQEYWHKGATSGNTLAVVEIRDDCDGDAILLRVDPAGPACHTGAESCFAPWLWRVVAERATTRPQRPFQILATDVFANNVVGLAILKMIDHRQQRRVTRGSHLAGQQRNVVRRSALVAERRYQHQPATLLVAPAINGAPRPLIHRVDDPVAIVNNRV